MFRSSRTRRLSAGLAVAALAFTTAGAATAAQAAPFAPSTSTAAAAEPGVLMNYVVNTRATKLHVKKVEQAVKAAGGTVVSSYDQLGVVIAQSTNPDFRTDVRQGRNGREVQSVGATRTAAVSEGPVGTAKKAAAKGLNAGEGTVVPTRTRTSSGTWSRSRRTRRTRSPTAPSASWSASPTAVSTTPTRT